MDQPKGVKYTDCSRSYLSILLPVQAYPFRLIQSPGVEFILIGLVLNLIQTQSK